MDLAKEFKKLYKAKNYDLILKIYDEMIEELSNNKDALYYVGASIEASSDHYLDSNGSYDLYIDASMLGSLEAKYRLAEYHYYQYHEYGEEEDLEVFESYLNDAAKLGYKFAKKVLKYYNKNGNLKALKHEI